MKFLTQMSTFASLFAFEKEFGVRSFMLSNQAQILKNVFAETEISDNMKVLEDYLPNWKLFDWEEVSW